MKNMILFLGASALILASSTGVFCLDVPLKYEKTAVQSMYTYGYGHSSFSAIKPAGNFALPALNSSRPLFALIRLADSSHLMVLDTVKPGDRYYSRLYIDRDGDGNLAGEKPLDDSIRKTKYGQIIGGSLPPVEMTILTDGARTPYRIQLAEMPFEISGQVAGIPFMYNAACGYRGAFTLGGAAYTILLGDTNGNGRFDDCARTSTNHTPAGHTPVFQIGDRVLLTDGKYTDYLNLQPLGDLLWLNDTLYEMKINISKGSMTLVETRSSLAPLKLPMKVERLSLYAEDTGRCLMVYKPSGDVLMLPPGRYRLLSYQAFRRDERGNLWRMCAQGTSGSPVTEVTSKGGAVLTYGEPYVPLVDINRNYRVLHNDISLNFTVEGKGKERMLALSTIESAESRFFFLKRSRIGKRPKEPTYTIVKADGEIIAKGSFHYG